MRLFNACKLVATALLLTLSAQVAIAHEGEDHGAPATRVSVSAMPRAEATSDTFELVAVAKAGELTIYLDRFATNEPVPGASVTVETPQGSVEAKAAPDGTYRLPAPWSSAPGHYDLIFTVAKDNVADVLTLTLDVPPATTGATDITSGRIYDPRDGARAQGKPFGKPCCNPDSAARHISRRWARRSHMGATKKHRTPASYRCWPYPACEQCACA